MDIDNKNNENKDENKKTKKKRGAIFYIAVSLIAVGFCFLAYPSVIRLYSNIANYIAQSGLYSIMSTNDPNGYSDVDTDALATSSPTGEMPWDMEDGNIGADIDFNITQADAVLQIDKIDLKVSVFNASSIQAMYPNMRKGASFYPKFNEPGKIGNVCIAAHRTGSSDYFLKLNELKKGDEIYLHTKSASYLYIVEYVTTVMPDDWSLLKQTDYAALTMSTCQEYQGVSHGKRLIVRARLEKIRENEQ